MLYDCVLHFVRWPNGKSIRVGYKFACPRLPTHDGRRAVVIAWEKCRVARERESERDMCSVSGWQADRSVPSPKTLTPRQIPHHALGFQMASLSQERNPHSHRHSSYKSVQCQASDLHAFESALPKRANLSRVHQPRTRLCTRGSRVRA